MTSHTDAAGVPSRAAPPLAGALERRAIAWLEAGVRVDLMRVPLEDPDAVRAWSALASPARQEKARRYHRLADAIRCLSSEALLRDALREAGLADADALDLVPDARGKPCVAGHPDVHVSLAHSGEWVATAVADRRVGIDVEVVRSLSEWPTSHFMSAAEREWWHGLDAAARIDAFYRTWTIKESALKAFGTGFTLDPCAFGHAVVPASVSRIRLEGFPGASSWRVRVLDAPTGVHAAVCVEAACGQGVVP